MSNLDTGDLVRELVGTACRCGKKKSARQTFCRACYFSLPKAMQQALYNRIGHGYEQAYAAAVAYFDKSKGDLK